MFSLITDKINVRMCQSAIQWIVFSRIFHIFAWYRQLNVKEVNPKETTRAYAFEMWMNAPMPMVTFFKTLNVSRLVRLSRNKGLKFNMLMGYCVGKAASKIKEFYMLPVGDKLMQYDSIAVNTIVANIEGELM